MSEIIECERDKSDDLRRDEEHTLAYERTRNDLFILLDGKRIAKRGRPGSRKAGTWVPVDPKWQVMDLEGGDLLIGPSGSTTPPPELLK